MIDTRKIAKQEVDGALNTIRFNVLAEMNRRRLNATGRMSASVSNVVRQDQDGTSGFLTALDYWVNVGSGTPPGGPVLVADIQTWLNAKGLDLSAWGIARRIRRAGSKDFREGNPNAFETGIDAWEDSPSGQELGGRTANEYGDAYVDILVNNIKA